MVDPACGSGAYLLGMMQELIELQVRLFNVTQDAKSLYDLKLEIIQRNLYGVDIDDFAVNIAMLRLWLSLAIDYEGATPEPLPNLDFKVVCGDSLLGHDPSSGAEVQVVLGQNVERVRSLGQRKNEYLRASTGAEKDRLRGVIAELTAAIRGEYGSEVRESAVDWRVQFAEVFAEDRRGFDIAIANPPYVQLQKDAGRLGKLYQGCGYATFAKTGDIYQLFYERGCQMLQPETGILAYITSNSWLRAEYGKRLRSYFSEKQTPLLLLELGKDVFDAAIVDSGVLMLRAGGTAQPFLAVDMDRVNSVKVPPAPDLWGEVRPDGEAPWGVMSNIEHSVLDKMRGSGTPLSNWGVNIYRGATTGYNSAFIVNSNTKDALVAADPKSAEILKPVLRGKDIHRFRPKWAGQWIISTFPAQQLDIKDFGAVQKHLLSFGIERLEQSGKVLPSGDKARKKTTHSWFELQDATAYFQEFTKEKLIWMDLTERGRFAVDDGSFYCLDTTFMMTGGPTSYLCAVLNSTLATWFMQNTASTSGMGVARWKRFTVERIPVPELSAAKQQPFVRLVDHILEAKAADPNADTSEMEQQIDWLVYDLYGLTDEETAAVADYFWDGSMSENEEDLALVRAMDEGDINDRVSLAEVREILRAPDEC